MTSPWLSQLPTPSMRSPPGWTPIWNCSPRSLSITAQRCVALLVSVARQCCGARVLKHLRQETWWGLEFTLRDSASVRRFVHADAARLPKKSALQATVGMVRPDSWEQVNRCLLRAARHCGNSRASKADCVGAVHGRQRDGEQVRGRIDSVAQCASGAWRLRRFGRFLSCLVTNTRIAKTSAGHHIKGASFEQKDSPLDNLRTRTSYSYS